MKTPDVVWVVTLANRTEVAVFVAAGLPDHIAAIRAEVAAATETGAPVFGSRPTRCTGITYRAHLGRSCPVHPNA